MATYNQIIQELNTIAENHRQINTFGFGDIWEIATSGDILYPMMWADGEGVDISVSDKTETYNFSLLFMDVVKNGEVNENEVLSDQLSIAKDVLAQLKHPSYPWTVSGGSLEDFTERFTDSVAGWRLSVSLILPFTSDRCAMPYEGNTSFPSFGTGGGSGGGGSVSGVSSVAGTGGRITVAPSTGDVVVDISASYVGQNSITTLGTITTGVWNGTSIGTSFTDAKIKTVTGTANRLSISGTATDPIFDISSTYVGQSTITTLGTITTGVWNGSAIGNSFLANSSLTIGTTNIALGATAPSLVGLTALAVGTNSMPFIITAKSVAANDFIALQNANGNVSALGTNSTGGAIFLNNFAATTRVFSINLPDFDSVDFVNTGRTFVFGGSSTVLSPSTVQLQSAAGDNYFSTWNSGNPQSYFGYGTNGGAVMLNNPAGNARLVSVNSQYDSVDFINTTRDLGIGLASSISAKVHIIKTSEQLRVGYDLTNYFNLSVSSSGLTAIASTGGMTITGGSAVGNNISFKSTSGNGTSTGLAHQFTGGNNGATTIASLYNDGQFLIGTTTRNATAFGIVKIAQGTSTIDIGESAAGAGAIWLTQATPSASNYTLRGVAAATTLNNPTSVNIAVNNQAKIAVTTSAITMTPAAVGSGVTPGLSFTAAGSTGQTAGTESISVNWDLSATLTHASNTAITTQRDYAVSARTHAFASATGTITNAATLAITGAPIAGTNAIITNSNALWVQGGAARFDGSLNLGYVAKTANYTIVHGTDYLINCTANAFTVTLPTAVGFTGRVYQIKNSTGGSTITVNTTSSQTIDGITSQTVPGASAMMVMSNGANWIII